MERWSWREESNLQPAVYKLYPACNRLALFLAIVEDLPCQPLPSYDTVTPPTPHVPQPRRNLQAMGYPVGSALTFVQLHFSMSEKNRTGISRAD